MPINVLVVYYSAYGHTYRMAQAVEEGAKSVPDSQVRLRRIPELEESRKVLSGQEHYRLAQEKQKAVPEVNQDDLRWADGICWGIPTRFGNMPAQVKHFV